MQKIHSALALILTGMLSGASASSAAADSHCLDRNSTRYRIISWISDGVQHLETGPIVAHSARELILEVVKEGMVEGIKHVAKDHFGITSCPQNFRRWAEAIRRATELLPSQPASEISVKAQGLRWINPQSPDAAAE
jgi:hypothetical protein